MVESLNVPFEACWEFHKHIHLYICIQRASNFKMSSLGVFLVNVNSNKKSAVEIVFISFHHGTKLTSRIGKITKNSSNDRGRHGMFVYVEFLSQNFSPPCTNEICLIDKVILWRRDWFINTPLQQACFFFWIEFCVVFEQKYFI